MKLSRRKFLWLALPAALAGAPVGCEKADKGTQVELTPPPPTPLKKREAPGGGGETERQ